MAKDIRWRIQFKSLNGTGCLVNIYDEDYTSSADTTKTGADVPFSAETGVTLLTGAENPFNYEESNDESLLSVIRYRTGYIRVIEASYGALAALYPETSTSHYVEFFYGNTLDFVGYMQAQSFQNEWVASPRVLEFPVVSPLGLADGIKLSVINPPSRVALSTLLSEAINGLGGVYDYVIIPDTSSNLEKKVSSLVVCPHNSSFSQSAYISNSPYEPITYGELIEGICNAFGWVVHETPTTVTFAKFEWDGNYARYTLANLATLASKTTVSPDGATRLNIDNYFTIASAEGQESAILPMSEITVNFDGDYTKSASFDFSKAKYIGESHYSNNHAAWFTPADGCIYGDHLNSYNTFNSSGYVANDGAIIALCGTKAAQSFYILTKVKYSWTQSTTRLFTIIFDDRPTAADFTISASFKYGNRVGELYAEGEEDCPTHYEMGVTIRCGDKYYAGNGTWQNSEPNPYPIANTEWDITDTPYSDPVIVSFFPEYESSEPAADLIAMYDLKLEEITAMYAEYKTYISNDAVIPGSKGSYDTASVSMLFSSARNNSHMLGDTVEGLQTTYPYLKTIQTRLQADFKGSLPTNPYQPMYNFWVSGWRWRLIGVNFTPRDDNYRLTLHRSSCLETINTYMLITITGNATSDAPAQVSYGDYVQFWIYPDAGYVLDGVEVEMGGEQITADAYQGDGYVSIEEVTGDVEVVVVTRSAIPVYTVSGVVTDGTNPLTGANVYFNDENYLTGSDGAFTFSNVPAGTYTLSATLSGHYFEPVSLVVSSDTTYNIVMLPYDARVEYLESTGTQYIMTTIYPTANYTFDTKVATTNSAYNCVFWGCRSSGTYNTANYQCYLNSNTQGSADYEVQKIKLYSTTTSLSTNWDSGIVPTMGVMNDLTDITVVSTMNTATYPMAMFGFNVKGSITRMSCRIGGLTVYDNGTKIADFIPVRVGTTGYMYDKVSGELFGNAGSGSFTYGSDV